MTDQPRIALVYDRVNTRFGGAENVLKSLLQLYPTAPLFTSVYDHEAADWAHAARVQTSFLQSLPFAKQHHRQLVMLMPLAFESLRFDEYDVIISITSAEAKGILTKPDQLHICYLLTPTRYLWSHTSEYSQGILKLITAPFFRYLRWWDVPAAKRPDVFIPISQRVAERCTEYYRRPTEQVIYPPVSLDQFSDVEHYSTALTAQGIQSNDYYLVVSRLVGYKRIDLAIEACQRLGRNLVIVGSGPEAERLQTLARNSSSQAKVIFKTSVQSTQLGAYYKNCRAFLAPGEEDFGIAALESHLFGKPALLHHRSGAAEISPHHISSVHCPAATVDAVVQGITELEARNWESGRIQVQVAKYGTAEFEKKFAQQINSLWHKFDRQLKSA